MSDNSGKKEFVPQVIGSSDDESEDEPMPQEEKDANLLAAVK
jgi:hypothetical protein